MFTSASPWGHVIILMWGGASFPPAQETRILISLIASCSGWCSSVSKSCLYACFLLFKWPFWSFLVPFFVVYIEGSTETGEEWRDDMYEGAAGRIRTAGRCGEDTTSLRGVQLCQLKVFLSFALCGWLKQILKSSSCNLSHAEVDWSLRLLVRSHSSTSPSWLPSHAVLLPVLFVGTCCQRVLLLVKPE